MPPVLAHLRQSYLALGILTAGGVVLWAAGWEMIGVLVTVVGGFGLFWGLIAAADAPADTARDNVIKAGALSDNDALGLSEGEAELVTLIRDRNIDPSSIVAKIQESK